MVVVIVVMAREKGFLKNSVEDHGVAEAGKNQRGRKVPGAGFDAAEQQIKFAEETTGRGDADH